MRSNRSADLGSLFGDSPADRAMERVPPVAASPEVRALAARMPAHVHLGTSSWAYPGWRGIVFGDRAPAAALASEGLAAYASWPLARTVGLDRAFYATPSADEYRALAALVPPAFRFTVKADQRVTRPDMGADGSTLGSTVALRAAGVANPCFLDAGFLAHEVIAPAQAGLGALLGPVVLQFPSLDLGSRGRLGGAEAFIHRLGGFLSDARSMLGAGVVLAVEVRNRECFRVANAQRYAAALRAGTAAHAFLQHPTVPSIGEQRRALAEAGCDASSFPAVVVRWMLPAGTTYQAAADRFEPFDRLQAPDPAVRSEVVAILASSAAARPGFVVINNKAEGSAVRSVEALAHEIAGGGPPGHAG
jgi:uncharacterized protein YecE (DUF72 family)